MPKLLLVADNAGNRELLSPRLSLPGSEVMFAPDGAESVSKTLSDQPNLLLMNTNLPEIERWAATRQITANPHSQNIPVMALTAYAMAGDCSSGSRDMLDRLPQRHLNL